MASWVEEIYRLSKIAVSQPHAAYAAFTHGVSLRCTYLARTFPHISELLRPIKDAVRQHFLPAITGRQAFSDAERRLFTLPGRLGGLAVPDVVLSADANYDESMRVSAPLCALVALQTAPQGDVDYDQCRIKSATSAAKRTMLVREQQAIKHSSLVLQCAIELACKKGASAWLTALPLDELGFHLHKAAFRDGISLRYGWPLTNLPLECVCGHPMGVDHALSCPCGFPLIEA